MLDVIDRDIFNLTNEIWLKIKYTFNSARGLLVIADEVFKMITGKSFLYGEDFNYRCEPFVYEYIMRIQCSLCMYH